MLAVSKLHVIASVTGKRTTSSKPSTAAPKLTSKVVSSTPQGKAELSGFGPQYTKQFTADGDWDVEWSYDCSNLKHPDRLIVSVYDSTGRVSKDTPPVVQFGAKGSGTQHYHQAGTYFLGVTSRCTWHAKTRRT